MNNLDWGDIPTWVAAVAAVLAVVIGGWQLSSATQQLVGMKESLRMNGLMAVLQIESDMNARKEAMLNVATRIIEATKDGTADDVALAQLQGQLRAYQENYLNVVDRLAFCILKDFVPEKDWRTEYRDAIARDVEKFAEFFGPETPYRNILQLHNLWQRTPDTKRAKTQRQPR